MDRRVSDAHQAFQPCRLDACVFSTDDYYAQRGVDSPMRGSTRADANVSSALLAGRGADSGMYLASSSPAAGSPRRSVTMQRQEDSMREAITAEERAAMDRRRQIVDRERVQQFAFGSAPHRGVGDADNSDKDSDDDGNGGLGSGVYKRHQKSISAQHNFTLDVMHTSHPHRITMQRSANDILAHCNTTSGEAFGALVDTLKHLEPVSMATRPSSSSSSTKKGHQLSSRKALLFMGQALIPRPPPPSSSQHNAKTARPASGISRSPSRVHFGDGGESGRSDNRPSRPNSASLAWRDDRPPLHAPVERRRASSPDLGPPAANAYHTQRHYAIGSVRNDFFISSLPKDNGGHIAALKHTIRPSDMKPPTPTPAPTSHTPATDLPNRKASARAGGTSSSPPPDATNPNTPFNHLYSAYWEPIAADAPPLFGTTDQRVGMHYVFSDAQAASPLAMQLTRSQQQQRMRDEKAPQQIIHQHLRASSMTPRPSSHTRRGSASCSDNNSTSAAGDDQPLVRASNLLLAEASAKGGVPVAEAPLGGAWVPPPKCGVSFTHAKLQSEKAQQASAACSKQAAAQGHRPACWKLSRTDRFATPVPGEVRPFWMERLRLEERQARMAEEKAARTAKQLIADGAPLPFVPSSDPSSQARRPSSARDPRLASDRYVVGSSTHNPHSRADLIIRRTMPEDPCKPHIPIARFTPSPRNFTFDSTGQQRREAAKAAVLKRTRQKMMAIHRGEEALEY